MHVISVGTAEISLESNQLGGLEVSIFICQETCVVTAQAAATSVRQCLSFSLLAVQQKIFYFMRKSGLQKRKLNGHWKVHERDCVPFMCLLAYLI